MHCITYVVVALAPSFLFSWVALPVDRPSYVQQVVLTLLYLCNLFIPLYYAGSFSLTWGMLTGVWAWANGLKMAVWLFCMPQEERRKRPFVATLFYWRERKKTIAAVEPDVKKQQLQKPGDLSPATILTMYFRHQLIFDVLDMTIRTCGSQQQSIAVFEEAVRMLVFRGPSQMEWSSILSSFGLCTLFSVYLQLQLQVTYDAFLIIFSFANIILPYLGIKSSWIKSVKVYLEEAADMPPAFDSPWETTSLRDYWSNRWHQFYNTCFVRLAFKPLRRMCGSVKVLRRTIPVWGVFALSGIMHEYFLFCTTGPGVYWYGGAGGWQMLFFLLQPIGIQIGDTLFRPGWPGRLWAIAWMILLSHLFVVPYFLSNYFDVVQVHILPYAVRLVHILRAVTTK
ncbi:membrane bound O-acyl transferase family-domain-containing protein [Fennellomyces sp. T-0311]|nr:membrane bound O-acyl transferase family-domain-containing protein [Fennellomyces sp. T-0311]